MGDVVNLIPDPVTQLIQDSEFVCDMARYNEQLLTEKYIRRKYGKLDQAAWIRLAESDDLIAAIEAEQVRRMRDGSSKREAAQRHIIRGPEVLASIMNSDDANNRHKVDAIKTLDGLATGGGSEGVPAADRFQIVINLGANLVERYDKPIAIGPNDDPDDTAPQGLIAIVAADKPTDDSRGNNL